MILHVDPGTEASELERLIGGDGDQAFAEPQPLDDDLLNLATVLEGIFEGDDFEALLERFERVALDEFDRISTLHRPTTVDPTPIAQLQRDFGSELLTGILRRSAAEVNQIVAAGIESGMSRRDVAEMLQARFPVEIMPDWRARLIAQTEVTRAMNNASRNTYARLGRETLQWLDGQPGACPSCSALHGKSVPVNGGIFEDPIRGLQVLHPPLHPGCRCSTTAFDESAGEEVDLMQPSLAASEAFYDPAQSRDARGRWSLSGAAGKLPIANGADHFNHINSHAPGTDSINVVWNEHDYKGTDGEWRGGYGPAKEFRMIDPDEPHISQDILYPHAIGKGLLIENKSPENAPGFNARAEKYWCTPGSAAAKDKGGMPHQSEIQKGAERLLGMNSRPDDRGIIYGKLSDTEYESMAKGALEAIHNGSPSQPTLWRGVEGDHAKQIAGLKPGDKFDVPLMSTSRDSSVAKSYSGIVAEDATIIRIAPGAKGHQISEKYYPDDQEVVTSGRFKVTEVATTTYHYKELPGYEPHKLTIVTVEQEGTWLVK